MNAEKTTDRIINIFRENSDEIIISKFSYKDLIIIYELLGGNESILLSKNRNKKGAVNAIRNMIRSICRARAFSR